MTMDIRPIKRTNFFEASRGTYWMQNRDRFIPLAGPGVIRHLQMQGVDVEGVGENNLSNSKRILNNIELDCCVEYAGPLAGYQAGPVDIDGGRQILVTNGFRMMEPNKEIECPWLQKFIDQLLGEAQRIYFMLWLKFARQSLREGSFRPGHFLCLCGPTACGKSLLQSIITIAISGRVADPWRYMIGATPFNGDLCQAEHLCIDDQAGSFDIRKRIAFGTSIKQVSAATNTSLHAKGCQAITLRLYRRGTFSLNNEAEKIMSLPPMDDDVRDKILLFSCSRAEVEEDKTRVWRRIVRELPGFLHYVDTWPLPKGIADSRYGFKAFQHPEPLAALQGYSPETRMLDLIDDVIFDASDRKEFEGTAEQLERELRNSSFAFAIDALLKFSSAAGTYLARLRKDYPERFTSKRIGGRTIWTITKRKTEGLF